MADPLLWAGAAGMALGALAVGWLGRGRAGRAAALAAVAVGPPLTMGTWYLAMALGSAVGTSTAGPVYWGRYADGVTTVPLLVLALGLLSGADRRTVLAGMAVGAYTMATTLAATLATGTAAAVWTGVSVGAFLALAWFLVAVARADGSDALVAPRTARRLGGFVLAAFLGYPVVWVLGPGGFALAPDLPLLSAGLALDLLVKPGFGLLAVRAGGR